MKGSVGPAGSGGVGGVRHRTPGIVKLICRQWIKQAGKEYMLRFIIENRIKERIELGRAAQKLHMHLAFGSTRHPARRQQHEGSLNCLFLI